MLVLSKNILGKIRIYNNVCGCLKCKCKVVRWVTLGENKRGSVKMDADESGLVRLCVSL